MKASWLILTACGAIAMGGCGESLRPDIDSVDPVERTAALAQAAQAGQPEAVPKLIARLGSVDPAERMLAIRGLERATDRDFGYRYFDPPRTRQRAIERWQAWWRRTRPSAADLTGEPDAGSKSNARGSEHD